MEVALNLRSDISLHEPSIDSIEATPQLGTAATTQVSIAVINPW